MILLETVGVALRVMDCCWDRVFRVASNQGCQQSGLPEIRIAWNQGCRQSELPEIRVARKPGRGYLHAWDLYQVPTQIKTKKNAEPT